MTIDHIDPLLGDGAAEAVRSAGGASVPGERDIPSVNQQRSLDVYKRQQQHEADMQAKVAWCVDDATRQPTPDCMLSLIHI